jgi:hypothetical protein
VSKGISCWKALGNQHNSLEKCGGRGLGLLIRFPPELLCSSGCCWSWWRLIICAAAEHLARHPSLLEPRGRRDRPWAVHEMGPSNARHGRRAAQLKEKPTDRTAQIDSSR